MTTVLSKKGQIVLPNSVRESMHLVPGQDFEVFIDDEDTITLRIAHPANHGLVDLLLACPAPFDLPPRERDTSAPLSL